MSGIPSLLLATHAEMSSDVRFLKALVASEERGKEKVMLACTKGSILVENSGTHLA